MFSMQGINLKIVFKNAILQTKTLPPEKLMRKPVGIAGEKKFDYQEKSIQFGRIRRFGIANNQCYN